MRVRFVTCDLVKYDISPKPDSFLLILLTFSVSLFNLQKVAIRFKVFCSVKPTDSLGNSIITWNNTKKSFGTIRR